jgi:hypothetical protein
MAELSGLLVPLAMAGEGSLDCDCVTTLLLLLMLGGGLSFVGVVEGIGSRFRLLLLSSDADFGLASEEREETRLKSFFFW